jgi:hypothetical protein
MLMGQWVFLSTLQSSTIPLCKTLRELFRTQTVSVGFSVARPILMVCLGLNLSHCFIVVRSSIGILSTILQGRVLVPFLGVPVEPRSVDFSSTLSLIPASRSAAGLGILAMGLCLLQG